MVHLNEHFTYKKIIKAVIMPIFMMVFTSVYSIVDGFFVSNYVNKTAFAALNLVFPIMMILGSLGFMMGAGGSALVAKSLGEGKKEEANKIFSGVVYATAIMGVVVTLLVVFFVKDISVLLGATEEMLPYCITYARILVAGMTLFMIQNLFQTFFIVAERPGLGFLITAAAGVTNIILDAVFIIVAKLGLAGAAYATVIGQFVGSIVPVIYFFSKKNPSLRLGKPTFAPPIIIKTITNGSSELLSNIAASIVSIVYNFQLLKFAGENGVSAYGIIMYTSFIFSAIFIGYAIGVAPIISYNYGAQTHTELKNVLKKSLVLNAVSGVIMTVISASLAKVLASIFVSYDPELLSMTTKAIRIYSISFIFMGINIFTSSFFTALNNGLISAIVSFSRTLVFQIGAVLLLPLAFGINGIWEAIIVAEGLAFVMDAIFIFVYRKKYNYQ